MSSYAPLWCKTSFSCLEGASHPSELVEEAHRLGITHLAVTDRDGVQGIVRAHVAAREVGLHLIVGSQVTIDDGSEKVRSGGASSLVVPGAEGIDEATSRCISLINHS